jgi:hypothetical protein
MAMQRHCGQRDPAMNEFLIESEDPSDFVVVHAAEGHRYHFHVARYQKGRVLSPVGALRQNNAADDSADFSEGAARRFAIREALALGLIDP